MHFVTLLLDPKMSA